MRRIGREMICLMEGRHVHPSTIYPGGVGTVATPTLLTDYLSRLLRCLDFIKKAVAMNDDVFDFFYEALPGYEKVGQRRILLGCWGAFNNPELRRLPTTRHGRLGQRDVRHPGRRRRRRAGHDRTSSTSTSASGSCSGSSYYEDWVNEETFVSKDPLGNPVDKRHPWNQTTIPKPQKRDLDGGNYSWVMSPRWYDKRTGDNLALDTGGGALARLWATALAEQGRHAVRQGDRQRRADQPAQDAGHARGQPRVEDPAVVQRDRARPRADLLRRLRGGHGAALPRQGVRGGPRRATRRCSRTSTSPTRRSAAASTRRCAACSRTTS